MSSLSLPVFSCSLDPASVSRRLADQTADAITRRGHRATVIDLAALSLSPFDNDRVFDSDAFGEVHRIIDEADGVVLAFPIYNWSPSSTVKSLIESTGATGAGRRAAWFDKVVTFVCAAGLPHSTMATGPLAQSLMLDFKCIVNPYTAYFSERDWEGDQLRPDRADRLDKTMSVHVELAQLLQGRTYSSDWEV
ncbi:NAD(P)H-dependent oxidoreductase [Curtobacterium sp. MCPF17_047]|uniref:NADPH-dependent FMN reductase n=1 Tax=Curtobacterium sp. MCPF17_047 TaxID=2175654 RepID=UPI000DA86E13|nr:NADPH-dependent FMN reductase [Curtobacterium sp. MCPF17_047]PZF62853.1 NAD(P)H-dependent oxidoreductase [Curtobacterium sp. MCPF17_047]